MAPGKSATGFQPSKAPKQAVLKYLECLKHSYFNARKQVSVPSRPSTFAEIESFAPPSRRRMERGSRGTVRAD
jgi:hypothetical protein